MIRAGTAADLALLVDLESRCFGSASWGSGLLEAALTADQVLVTTAGDGYAIVRVVADTADLDRIAVLDESRRRGVGSMLLEAALDRAARQGATRVLLEVADDNAAAVRLYDREGFVEIHRRPGYYPSGAAAIVMERVEVADSPPHGTVVA